MIIPLIIALLGCTIAGVWDLYTTDIPDEVSESMMIFGGFYWFIESLLIQNIKPFLISLSVGILFFAFGYILYKTGQWGGGDAKLLSGVGFLIPFYKGIPYFSLAFVINVFVVGAVYVIIYALILGAMKNVFPKFFKEIPKIPLLVSLILIISGLFIPSRITAVLTELTGILILFWYYAKTIENHIFKRRVRISDVKVGDVLLKSKEWEGITYDELKKLKRSKKKYVTIKEGVRFGPVFLFALIFTILYGNLIFLFLM